MRSPLYYLTHSYSILTRVALLTRWFVPDKLYLKFLFRDKMGYCLNLTSPKTFSEKLQWLKLYNRRSEYTTMVDKAAVKDYVARIIGPEFIIPTIGIWNRPEEIDWDNLPNKFVLKTTHGGGNTGVVICRNKSTFNRQEAIKKLKSSLKSDIYKRWGEWPYKNVPKRVIAEEYIGLDSDTTDLCDYKFFCFNGTPKFCQVISGRGIKMCIDFFDRAWNHQPFHEPKNFPFADVEPQKPQNIESMWKAAEILSKDMAFVRIDFYDVNNRIYFGEITFYPTSGMGGFEPENYDKVIGDMIKIPV